MLKMLRPVIKVKVLHSRRARWKRKVWMLLGSDPADRFLTAAIIAASIVLVVAAYTIRNQ